MQCENVARGFVKHPKQSNPEGQEKWPKEDREKKKKKKQKWEKKSKDLLPAAIKQWNALLHF